MRDLWCRRRCLSMAGYDKPALAGMGGFGCGEATMCVVMAMLAVMRLGAGVPTDARLPLVRIRRQRPAHRCG